MSIKYYLSLWIIRYEKKLLFFYSDKQCVTYNVIRLYYDERAQFDSFNFSLFSRYERMTTIVTITRRLSFFFVFFVSIYYYNVAYYFSKTIFIKKYYENTNYNKTLHYAGRVIRPSKRVYGTSRSILNIFKFRFFQRGLEKSRVFSERSDWKRINRYVTSARRRRISYKNKKKNTSAINTHVHINYSKRERDNANT